MSKKNITTLCLACLSIAVPLHAEEGTSATLTTLTEQPAFSPFAGKVIGSKVRIRIQPRLDASIVYETQQNQLCAIVGEEGGFYAVKPQKGSKGYVFRSFVLDGVVEGDRVNVRLYPDLEAPIITQLHNGDSIQATVSTANSKWLEIDLPDTASFYIAKEYVENIGPIALIAQKEQEDQEVDHYLRTACLFAQSQLQRPFEQIDFERMSTQFEQLIEKHPDSLAITGQAREIYSLLQDVYAQKKMAFLGHASPKMGESQALLMQKLAAFGLPMASPKEEVAEATAVMPETKVAAAPIEEEALPTKMFVWRPLEESLFRLWAAAERKERATMDDFYHHEKENAVLITGVIDTYNRPVKNCPGDFLLRSDHFPVAFLYSTRVNLNQWLGKPVSLLVAPRPNNHFAFPAYYVLAVE